MDVSIRKPPILFTILSLSTRAPWGVGIYFSKEETRPQKNIFWEADPFSGWVLGLSSLALLFSSATFFGPFPLLAYIDLGLAAVKP